MPARKAPPNAKNAANSGNAKYLYEHSRIADGILEKSSDDL